MSANQRKSILLVDDESLILSSLSRDLVDENHEVTLAATGEEAIDKINSHYFDLVITDLRMPGIDGLHVLEATKQRDAQAMVFILTGYADLDSAVEALRFGADDFLQKPCDIDELLCRMSNCFTKQEMQRKIAFYENILPVCCYCRKIRDDLQGEPGKGYWYSLEDYLVKTKGVNVSHGCCPDCYTEQIKEVSLGKSSHPKSQNKLPS